MDQEKDVTHATLPPEYEDRNKIGLMKEGDSGYTLSWAVHVDQSRRLWLNTAYPIRDSPYGTSDTYVQCTAEGWVVHLVHKYEISGSVPNRYYEPIARLL